MPISEAQLAANRANAKRSTGPRTAEGKAVSRQNAVKHGLLAKAIIPRALEPYESQADLDALLDGLNRAFAPVDLVESLLVQQIASAYWRLIRLHRAEAGDIALRRQPNSYVVQPLPILEQLLPLDPSSPAGLRRQRDTLTTLLQDPHQLRAELIDRDAALEDVTDDALAGMVHARIAQIEAQLAEQGRHEQDIHDALCSLPDIDTALKFARYARMLQLQLDRAYVTLERRQRRRGGEFVPPPVEIALVGSPPPGSGKAPS